MTVHRRWVLAGVAAALLGGCSIFGGNDGEDETLEARTQAPQERPREPVIEVERVEIGQTRDGIALTAFGIAPGLGYGRPRLVARRGGAPAEDGYLDFDFFVTPPDPSLALGQGERSARRVRVDLIVPNDRLRGRSGIRIHGVETGVRVPF